MAKHGAQGMVVKLFGLLNILGAQQHGHQPLFYFPKPSLLQHLEIGRKQQDPKVEKEWGVLI